MLIGGGKQVGFGLTCFIIMAQFGQKSFGKQCIALFAALALFDFDEHLFAFDVLGL